MGGPNKIFKQTFEEWVYEMCCIFGDSPEKVINNLGEDFLICKYNIEKNKALENEIKRREKISKNEISDETRDKLSKANKGNKNNNNVSEEGRRRQAEKMKELWKDPEYRKNQSEKHSGKLVSEETRKKLSELHKGHSRKLSPESIEKMSRSLKKRYQEDPSLRESARNAALGQKFSYETRKKISEANKGRIIPEDEKMRRTEGVRRYYANLSEEEREKNRQRAIEIGNRLEVKEKLKGREVSKETRNKLSERFKGKKLSEEHVAKLRDGQRRRHERDGMVKRKTYVTRCEKCKEENRRSCTCKRIITEVTRKKMRGRKISDESKEKISKSLKAQKFIHSCGKITSVAGNASQHSKRCGCTYKPLNESNI